MYHIDMAIYLIHNVVFCTISMPQVWYFYTNTFITIWCQSAKGPSVDYLTQPGIFPIWQEKSFEISQNIDVWLFWPGSGGRLNRSIETLVFCVRRMGHYVCILIYFANLTNIQLILILLLK